MIRPAQNPSNHLASSWAAGLSLLCLGIGLHGATAPLLPVSTQIVKVDLGDDTVMVETFLPPDSAPAADSPQEPEPETPREEEDFEIPPLPELTPPLSPPEMVEITPLEEARELPVPKPVAIEKKPEPPKPAPRPTPRPSPQRQPSPSSNTNPGGGGSGSSPVLFTGGGGGGGRFPSPTYPASARSAKQQGTVRVLVTVEASGLPSSVEVSGSSGYPALDRAARDAIQRRWRWPSGPVRKYIVPVRFVLQ